jgi:cystathionine beta-synthase
MTHRPRRARHARTASRQARANRRTLGHELLHIDVSGARPERRGVPAPEVEMRQAPQPALFSLIGDTPLIEVSRLDTGPCQLFLKLECQNPGGSIKDRIGRSMIEAAEADGSLRPGGVVVEATAGNTGLGLALVARIKGYRVVLVVPDKMAIEKVLHLKALGAEIHLTRSDVAKGHPEYYQDYAARLAREIPGAWFADQFNNPANPRAHATTTGPELWRQCAQRLDAIVVGVGSSGTLTGLSQYFGEVQPALEFVLADPEGSILAEYVTTGRVSEVSGSWAVEGIGEDFIPAIADFSRVRHAYTIGDEESFNTARALLLAEGILAGSSSGTLLAAALKYCRAQSAPKRVATFVCDTGTRYLTKVYSDGWMVDQGLLARAPLGDLRDLIGRRFDDGDVVTVAPSDTLLTAFNRMRSADLAQLPVLENGRLAGIIDESDLLLHVTNEPARFGAPVASTMTSQLRTLRPSASMAQLREILDRGLTAVICDGDHFHGLITRFDLLNHLRRTLS